MSTQTLIPKNTMQTIKQNAQNLYQNGYRIELVMGDMLFRVFNLHKPSSYTVEMRGEPSCECICFQRNGTCKHVEGCVLLIQSQLSMYYLRRETILDALKRNRGTALYEAQETARADQLDQACWELECALSNLTGTDEFMMPRKLSSYIPEVGEVVADRKAAA